MSSLHFRFSDFEKKAVRVFCLDLFSILLLQLSDLYLELFTAADTGCQVRSFTGFKCESAMSTSTFSISSQAWKIIASLRLQIFVQIYCISVITILGDFVLCQNHNIHPSRLGSYIIISSACFSVLISFPNIAVESSILER